MLKKMDNLCEKNSLEIILEESQELKIIDIKGDGYIDINDLIEMKLLLLKMS